MTQTVSTVMEAIRTMSSDEQRQILAGLEGLMYDASQRSLEQALILAGISSGGAETESAVKGSAGSGPWSPAPVPGQPAS